MQKPRNTEPPPKALIKAANNASRSRVIALVSLKILILPFRIL